MTTGTEEFGQAEFGANDQGSPHADPLSGSGPQPYQIPAQPGPQPGLPPRQRADYARGGYAAQPQQPQQSLQSQQPQQQMPQPAGQPGPEQSIDQAPWIGGTVGYAEAMFGAGQQQPDAEPAASASQPTASRLRTSAQQGVPRQASPHQAAPQQAAPMPTIPQQVMPQQMPMQGMPMQGMGLDAPTTEFFPGAIFGELPLAHRPQQYPDPNGEPQQHVSANGHWTAEPAEPVQPAQPVQPVQPVHAVQASQPTQPAPSAPLDHGQPAPIQPTVPAQMTPPQSAPAQTPPVQTPQVQAPPAQSIPRQVAPAQPGPTIPPRPSPLRSDSVRPPVPDSMVPPRRAGASVSGLSGRLDPRSASAAAAATAAAASAAAPVAAAPAPPVATAPTSPGPAAPAAGPVAPVPQPRAATRSAQPAPQPAPQLQPQPAPQAVPQPRPEPVPLPVPEQMAVPVLESSAEVMDLDEADELIVPWQAQSLSQSLPVQPLHAEPPRPEPLVAEQPPVVEQVVAEPVPVQQVPVHQAPVAAPSPAEAMATELVVPEPQPAEPAEPEPAAPMADVLAPTANVTHEVAHETTARETPQENDEQAEEVLLIPRGTRRRSAQQYLAEEEEQEQSVQPQPVQPQPLAPPQPQTQPQPLAPPQPQPHLSAPVSSAPHPSALRPSAPLPSGLPPAAQAPRPAPAPEFERVEPVEPIEPESGLELAQPRQAGYPETSRAPGYDHETLAAVYRVIHERRDVRNDFLADPIPTEMLTRILEAAHTAPSVGFSQPWDFLVIRDRVTRESIHDLAVRQRRAYAASLPKARAKAFAALKIESILDTPINIVVTCDPTRGGRHTLGRYSQPMMAPFSSCLAVENLWLAARAEGLGVGWVSFFDERELAAVLDLPNHVQIVAYLCVGFVKQFPTEPELAGAGWAKRRPLSWAVHEETFGHRALPGAEPISLLNETIDAVRPLDPVAMAQARDRQNRMTKPPGSLGALETVGEQLAGLAGVCPPPMPEPAALAVFAGDHGVHAQGVTPWPQAVTAQMVGNFLAGGAVINAFAKQVGAEVCVVDVGVAADLSTETGLIPRKIRYGTADMTQGPAMSRSEAIEAVEAGIETARDLIAAGNRCLLTGDMGIANTTASAALIATFTGASSAQVTGYGTGIDEQTYAHKVEVVHRALQLHRPDPQDPIGVLAAFGGLEHAALAGFILGAAALRVPVILDGVIAGAAALVAQALAPEVTAACVAGHRSAEPGHALALEALEVFPLIDLELRLGEGSGAALALPLVGAAVRALREVATFDDAGVAEVTSAEPASRAPRPLEAARPRQPQALQPAQPAPPAQIAQPQPAQPAQRVQQVPQVQHVQSRGRTTSPQGRPNERLQPSTSTVAPTQGASA